MRSEVRVRVLQTFQLEIERWVGERKRGFTLSGFRRARGLSVGWRFREEMRLELDRYLPERASVRRVDSLHEGGEFEHVASGPAAEALEYALIEIR